MLHCAVTMVPLLAMHTPRGRLFLRVWDKHAFLHGHTEPVRANLTLPRPAVRLSSSGARSWTKHHRFRLQNASRRCGVCVNAYFTVFYDKPSASRMNRARLTGRVRLKARHCVQQATFGTLVRACTALTGGTPSTIERCGLCFSVCR